MEYGKRGIGKLLVQKSLQIAESLGHAVALSHLGSAYSAKICDNCGFETIAETSYAEFYELYSQMSEETKQLHPKCVSMIKRLGQTAVL